LGSDSRAAKLRLLESKRFAAGLALILFALFALQLCYHAYRASTTFDEPIHILAGHRIWQCGDFGINPEPPPLAQLIAAAPLNFRSWTEPAWDCGSRIASTDENTLAARKFLTANGMDRIVFSTRLAAASLSLTLAALVYFAARKMFGGWEALIALALLAFEPNLIAHGSLVTTDMAITCTAFASAYALYRFRTTLNVRALLLLGLLFGLMLGSKHSAVVFVPVFFLLFFVDAIFFAEAKRPVPNELLRHAAAFVAPLLVAAFVIWALYGFRYAAIPHAHEPTALAQDRGGTASNLARTAFVGLNRARILPEAYLLGLGHALANGGRPAFIFDRSYPTGQWFYFPLAFAVKSSAALLLLSPLGLLLPVVRRDKRRELMFLLVPAVAFFAVSLNSKLNIGVRHILPIYPFVVVAAAAGAVACCRRWRSLGYVLLALLLFHSSTSLLRVEPHYLAFSNDFWGGVNATHRVFPGDSNTEWGQNDKLVGAYLARANISDCWYAPYQYGDVLPILPCRLMPGTFVARESLAEPPPAMIEGTVLLSTTVLPPRGSNDYLPIAASKPIAQIGGSVFVYRGPFPIPLDSLGNHAK
jgi:4-amino-4-deoxy-L-arabinose transferase-like glycosyltransferase